MNSKENIMNEHLIQLQNQIKIKQSAIAAPKEEEAIPCDEETDTLTKLIAYPTKKSLDIVADLTKENEEILFNIQNETHINLLRIIFDCLNVNFDDNHFNTIKDAYLFLEDNYKARSLQMLFKNELFKRIYSNLFYNFKYKKLFVQHLIEIFENNEGEIERAINNKNDKMLANIGIILKDISDFLTLFNSLDDSSKEKLNQQVPIKSLKV